MWRQLCALGDRVGFDVVFVSAQPSRRLAEFPHIHERHETYLRVDPQSAPVEPVVGAVLPAVGFPALPAACAQLLEPVHAAQAQAIYDECLVAAFDALPYDRQLEQGHVDAAFRAALARTPDLGAVPLASHALRAAGLLRGYDVAVHGDDSGGVAFDALLTADRLDQLCRLVSAEQAAAGVLAGLPAVWGSRATIGADGTCVHQAGTWQAVSDRAAALLRAWLAGHPDSRDGPSGAPPRPSDARRRLLWRVPAPKRLRFECRVIECRSPHLIADPPISWTRPPRAHRRNGLARSARGS